MMHAIMSFVFLLSRCHSVLLGYSDCRGFTDAAISTKSWETIRALSAKICNAIAHYFLTRFPSWSPHKQPASLRQKCVLNVAHSRAIVLHASFFIQDFLVLYPLLILLCLREKLRLLFSLLLRATALAIYSTVHTTQLPLAFPRHLRAAFVYLVEVQSRATEILRLLLGQFVHSENLE